MATPPFEQLRTMTDDDLRAAYDAVAPSSAHGFGFYLDELNRRALAQAGRDAHRVARTGVIVSVLAVVVAVAAILVQALAQPPEVQPCTVLVGSEQRTALCLTADPGPAPAPAREWPYR